MTDGLSNVKPHIVVEFPKLPPGGLQVNHFVITVSGPQAEIQLTRPAQLVPTVAYTSEPFVCDNYLVVCSLCLKPTHHSSSYALLVSCCSAVVFSLEATLKTSPARFIGMILELEKMIAI